MTIILNGQFLLISSDGLFLKIILLVSIFFVLLSGCMSVYMILRRKRKIKSGLIEEDLIDKYQNFLSDMIIVPNFYNENQKSVTVPHVRERLQKEDISSPYKRRILIQEIFSFKKYLQGNSSTQLVNYFFGLGLQEDVQEMFRSNNWAEQFMALKYVQAFDISECLTEATKLVESKNKDLSFQALVTMLSLEKDMNSIETHLTEFSDWEKHKLVQMASTQGLNIDTSLFSTQQTSTKEPILI